MSLFGKISCPKCGSDNKKDTKFCSKCGFPLDSKSSDVSREMGKDRAWKRGRGDFACKFDVSRDLKGFLSKGVTLEQGTKALLLQGGEYKCTLDPTYYSFHGKEISSLPVNFENHATIIIVDAGEVPLTFAVPNDLLRTRNDVKVSVSGRINVRLTDAVAFLENYLKSQLSISTKDIEDRISRSLQTVVQSKVSEYTAEELRGNAKLVSDLEQTFKSELNRVIKSTGLEIVGLTSLSFDEGRWNEIREAREKLSVDGAREQVEFENRMRHRNLENAETIDNIKADAAVTRERRDISNQFEDEAIARRRTGELGEVSHQNKIDDLKRDQRLTNEDIELNHNLRNSEKSFAAQQERERKEFEQDLYEINALMGIQKQKKMDNFDVENRGLDIKERNLKIERDAERQRVENFSGASTEQILAALGNDPAAKNIIELRHHEIDASMSEEKILARGGNVSPEVAKAFQAKYSAEREKEFSDRMDKENRENMAMFHAMYHENAVSKDSANRESLDRMEAMNRENSQNMKDVLITALNANSAIGTARETARNPGSTIVTGGGLGAPVVINTNDTSSKKRCPNCGHEVPVDANFCSKCGSKL